MVVCIWNYLDFVFCVCGVLCKYCQLLFVFSILLTLSVVVCVGHYEKGICVCLCVAL